MGKYPLNGQVASTQEISFANQNWSYANYPAGVVGPGW